MGFTDTDNAEAHNAELSAEEKLRIEEPERQPHFADRLLSDKLNTMLVDVIAAFAHSCETKGIDWRPNVLTALKLTTANVLHSCNLPVPVYCERVQEVVDYLIEEERKKKQ